MSANRDAFIGIPYDFGKFSRTLRSNSVRIVLEFPVILGGGVGGSGFLLIGWVGPPGWCRSKVGTPAKEQNPGTCMGTYKIVDTCTVLRLYCSTVPQVGTHSRRFEYDCVNSAH